MTGQMFDLVITAQGEVRNEAGELVSSEPVEATMRVTAAQLAEMGITSTPEGIPS